MSVLLEPGGALLASEPKSPDTSESKWCQSNNKISHRYTQMHTDEERNSMTWGADSVHGELSAGLLAINIGNPKLDIKRYAHLNFTA